MAKQNYDLRVPGGFKSVFLGRGSSGLRYVLVGEHVAARGSGRTDPARHITHERLEGLRVEGATAGRASLSIKTDPDL